MTSAANTVPSLEIRKNGTKLEKSAPKTKFTGFQRRHFFPLRMNFWFFVTWSIATKQVGNFFVFCIDKTYQHI